MAFGKKLENFWYYNKNKILLCALFLAFALIISRQVFTKTYYDNEIVIAGNVPATLANSQKFNKDIEYIFKDVTGNGKVEINETFIPFGGNLESVTDAEMAMTYPQQLQAILAADDANIFIVSEDVLVEYGRDKAFADLSKIQNETGRLNEKYNNGILIKDRKLISELKLFDDVDYYVAVRVNDGLDKLKGSKKTSYENAYNFARELAK